MSDRPDHHEAVAWTADLVVRPSRIHGLGVFARRPFEPGEVVERVPCVIVPEDEMHFARMRGTIMHRYPMPGVPTADRSAWMLGYGALYNHATDGVAPNTEWEYVGGRIIEFRAIAPIGVDDEIVYDYGEDTGF